MDGVVAATDIIAPPSFVIGSVFADEAGEGFREYLNTIFTAKNAFSRPQYYQEIIESRKSWYMCIIRLYFQRVFSSLILLNLLLVLKIAGLVFF